MTQFVAEFTTNHMGNYNVLEEMAKKAKEAGADFIKMQKKDIESYYSQEKLDQPFDSPYGKTYRDYRKIFEFNMDDLHRFDMFCRKKLGIPWFTTVQDVKSLKEMLRFHLPKYKIASSSARDWEFIQAVNKLVPKNAEIVVSVAGSDTNEIRTLIELIPQHRLVLQHCVAEYPCPLENLRFGNIVHYKGVFESDRIKIGYSGHEQGIAPSVALARKHELYTLERHFCLSRHSFVHHIECSLEPDEFAEMVSEIKGPTNSEYVLPELAWNAGFGMSEIEREFLEKQTYGNTYLGGGSKIE
ncbi:MAG: N-acetylneuraminate synthase family protein [Candidatus Thorarchaeota archaeon]|jgi:N-acetylneuraminate synthase